MVNALVLSMVAVLIKSLRHLTQKVITKLADAMSYAEKEDAQAIIDKMGLDGCEFEIRKAK